MALKKVIAFNSPNGHRTATVYRDAEWQEYRVKFYRDGVHLVDADYHCTDKVEAVEAAISYVNRGN